ncbi:AsnC family transcriptional regulator, partial [Halobacteriales archaeon QH_10_67_13]
MTYKNLDRRLVNALLGDGRASLRNLAEQLEVSVTTVSNHLSELEESEVDVGFRLQGPTGDGDTTGVLALADRVTGE